MQPEAPPRPHPLEDPVAGYSLPRAPRGRRSRRFGPAMRMEIGPMAYQSGHDPPRLGEEEEALPAFAMHVDLEFYDRYYRPEAQTEPQREHMTHWHKAAGA